MCKTHVDTNIFQIEIYIYVYISLSLLSLSLLSLSLFTSTAATERLAALTADALLRGENHLVEASVPVSDLNSIQG